MDLCVVIPENALSVVLKLCHYQLDQLKQWKKSIYNSQFMCECLESIGMVNNKVLKDGFVPSCEFIDPMYDIRCRLGLNFRSLVYEAERLLLAYFDLDTRIRPFVDAIFMFTTHHKISKCKSQIY